jgi:hypothetical protein
MLCALVLWCIHQKLHWRAEFSEFMAYRDKEGGRHEGINRIFRDLFPDKDNSSVTQREDAMILRSAVFAVSCSTPILGSFLLRLRPTAFRTHRGSNVPLGRYVLDMYAIFTCMYVCIHGGQLIYVCIRMYVCTFVYITWRAVMEGS